MLFFDYYVMLSVLNIRYAFTESLDYAVVVIYCCCSSSLVNCKYVRAYNISLFDIWHSVQIETLRVHWHWCCAIKCARIISMCESASVCEYDIFFLFVFFHTRYNTLANLLTFNELRISSCQFSAANFFDANYVRIGI